MSGRHYPFGDEGEGDGRGGYGQSGPISRRRSPNEGAFGEGAGGSRHSGGPTRGGYGPSGAGGRSGPSWGGGDAPARPSGDGWGHYAGGGGRYRLSSHRW